ncbi:DNA repair protein RecN [Lachnoclostridium sp. An118]|uniref:DNA repair protein RecN n=1 Tax=Lachnoclostridium sp. An118 TaxID=1965547 RepID=UPI000B37D2F2|nr:DNA repair protein RecN [Lachnoclostridium sp. An118]OUQ52634.1 DNA repair protein RecN [Lachnoclostridium sp. An118]
MLQNLHVKNLALIDEIEIDFQKGLNILTGETGAGKSIILGSVSLALGGRYSTDILRKGARYGFVELTFTVENEDQEEKLGRLDIFPEEGAVVLSRRLMEGRSTSKINGETVPISLLKEAAGILIDIHGQHEHQSLLYKKRQLELLDAFSSGDILDAKEKVRSSFQEYRKWKKELEEADQDEAQRAKEASFLEFEIGEIEEAALADGEDEELEESYRRMVNSKRIVEGVSEAHGYTSGADGSASECLSRAARCLSEAAGLDEDARQLYEQLLEVDSLLNDLNRELADYEKSLEFSDEDFTRTENRLNEINRLKTKYGSTIGQIKAYCEEKRSRLLVLNDYDRYLEELKEKYERSLKHLEKNTTVLTRLRKEQGLLFAEQITEGLRDLNFADVRFEIDFSSLPEYTSNGKDDIAYMISMNPGEPLKPLAEVASGGELSRIMLAIKTVMADRDDIPTLIFDEIDVGISGRTAQKVSEKMAVIGKTHQVICITHLAQIAAQADAHYLIEKTVEEGKTHTDIRQLSDKESVEELARILGGAKITDAVLENAREMKELARGGNKE